jgi:hypothetical protein
VREELIKTSAYQRNKIFNVWLTVCQNNLESLDRDWIQEVPKVDQRQRISRQRDGKRGIILTVNSSGRRSSGNLYAQVYS